MRQNKSLYLHQVRVVRRSEASRREQNSWVWPGNAAITYYRKTKSHPVNKQEYNYSKATRPWGNKKFFRAQLSIKSQLLIKLNCWKMKTFLAFMFRVYHAVLSVPCGIVVTCWERADLLCVSCFLCFRNFPVRCGIWLFRFLIVAFFLTFKPSSVVFTMLINFKMPTIVGILTFMSMMNSMLSWVEHENVYNLRASSLHRDRKHTKNCITNFKTMTKHTMGTTTMTKHNSITTSKQTAAATTVGRGEENIFTDQIFILHSSVVKT